jgi:hypothetical protein
MDYFELHDIKIAIYNVCDVATAHVLMRLSTKWLSIVQAKFDYSYENQLPLLWNYAFRNHEEVVRLLNRTEVLASENWQMLRWAICYQDIPMVNRCLVHKFWRDPRHMDGINQLPIYYDFTRQKIERQGCYAPYSSNIGIDNIFLLCCHFNGPTIIIILEILVNHEPGVLYDILNHMNSFIVLQNYAATKFIFEYSIKNNNCAQNIINIITQMVKRLSLSSKYRQYVEICCQMFT